MSQDQTKQSVVKENIVTFLDATGRALFGERIPALDTKETIAIKNPVVVHVVPQQQGTMALQLLPAFFREFLGESDGSITINFPKAMIALSEPLVFDFKLYGQYEAMFKPQPLGVPNAAPAQPQVEAKRIKLFDEK